MTDSISTVRLLPLCCLPLLVGCPAASDTPGGGPGDGRADAPPSASAPAPAPPAPAPPAPAPSPASETPPVDVDSDGDGLGDAAELELGTSPRLADTDGDGFSDGQEVLELGFDPATNPYRFHPRIADVPRIDVRVQSAPKVYIQHTTSEGKGRSFDNSQSVEESRGFQTERGGSTSLRLESSATVGVELSSTVGVMPGTTATGSYSTTFSAASESSFNWSSSESRENRSTVTESRSWSESEDVTRTGARVEVAVEIVNLGSIGCTLQTMALGLRKLDPVSGRYVEIGQLEPESDRTFIDVTSLAPGERVDGLVFRAEVSLQKAELLLGPGPMAVRTLHFELLDEERRSFDHRATRIGARTAAITIDSGDGGIPRTWLVATHSADGRGLPLRDALGSVLRIPVEEGTTLWRDEDGVGSTKRCILSLGDVATSSADGAYWTVEVSTDDGRGGRRELYGPFQRDLDLASLRLAPTRSVGIVHVSDADRDGLGARTERLLGLDPARFDTDGDGRGDGEELRAGRNPLRGRASVEVARVRSVERRLTLVLDLTPGEDAAIAALEVDWGDGTAPETFAGAPAEVTHEYPDYGTWTSTIAVREAETSVAESVALPGRPVRVRLQPALTRTWSLEEPGDLGGGLFSAAIAAPDGGAFLSTFLPAGGKASGEEEVARWSAARLSPRGEITWSRTVAPAASERLIDQHSKGRRLALDPSGRTVLLAVDHRVVALDARTGVERWSLTPHRDQAMRVRRLGLAVSPTGRVFVVGRARKGERGAEHTFLTRIDAGAAVSFSRPIEDTASDLVPHVVVGPRGEVLVATGTSVRVLDDKGEPRSRFDHSITSVLGLVATEGGIALAGVESHRVETPGGGSQVSLLGAIREYDLEGNVAWGHISPPSSASNTRLLYDLARDAEGRCLASELVSSKIDPDGADGAENRRLRLQLAAWSPSGDRLFSVPVEEVPSRIGLLLLMLNYSIEARPGGGVLLAWTDVSLPEGAEAPKLDALRFRPRVACWAPNPDATALLEEDD